MKYYVGITLSFNTSAALCDENGQIISAISEERLTREKNTKRIPIHALKHVIESVKDKDSISPILAYTYYDHLDKFYFSRYEPKYPYVDVLLPEDNLLAFLLREGFTEFFDILRVDHHEAHAYSIFPYYHVPRNSLIITSDGYGDDKSQTHRFVSSMDNPFLIYSLKDSIGLVYQFVTGALGLKMHQHEGKVTGLAAYGNYARAHTLLNSLYARFSTTMYWWNYKGESFQKLQQDIFMFCGELLKFAPCDVQVSAENKDVTDLCLMVQLFIENEFIWRVRMPNQNKYHLFLAGGLFANVRLNSLIAAKTDFKSVNVAPPMGDEGTAIGTVLSRFKYKDIKKGEFKNVFSGIDTFKQSPMISYDKEKWSSEVYFTKYAKEDDLIKVIAQMLADGEIVHVRRGISEFGPRALCHSSTFYQPSNPQGTKYLNRTLGRSEYMPYAPIILEEDVHKIFEVKDANKLRASLQYMTATLKSHGSVIAQHTYAGAIHVDGTARPQILYDKKSFAYRLLKEYKRLTGKLMLINTSWNIHNNPTVATTNDSKRTWMESGYCGAALVHDQTVFRHRTIGDEPNGVR